VKKKWHPDFLKAYDIFCQNHVSICFHQTKDTKLQMSL